MSAVKANNSGTETKQGFGERTREYFISLGYEFKKITWPERTQWIQSTIVVLMFTTILIAVLVGLDSVVSLIFQKLLGI